MTFFNSILSKKEYNYFDLHDNFQTKKLNIFQRVVRRVFGWYAETHLLNVVNKAYISTLNNKFKLTNNQQQELLKLIATSTRVYGFAKSGIWAPYELDDHQGMILRVKYDIRQNESGTFVISSVNFYCRFTFNQKFGMSNSVSIIKNESQKMVAVPYPGLFEEYNQVFSGWVGPSLIIEDYEKKVTNLIAKILSDSSTCPEMNEIEYYGRDPNLIFPALQRNSPCYLSESDVQAAQQKAMSELGWEYIRDQEKWDISDIRRVYRVYLLRKQEAANSQTFGIRGLNQRLSMAFAAPLLESSKTGFSS